MLLERAFRLPNTEAIFESRIRGQLREAFLSSPRSVPVGSAQSRSVPVGGTHKDGQNSKVASEIIHVLTPRVSTRGNIVGDQAACSSEVETGCSQTWQEARHLDEPGIRSNLVCIHNAPAGQWGPAGQTEVATWRKAVVGYGSPDDEIQRSPRAQSTLLLRCAAAAAAVALSWTPGSDSLAAPATPGMAAELLDLASQPMTWQSVSGSETADQQANAPICQVPPVGNVSSPDLRLPAGSLPFAEAAQAPSRDPLGMSAAGSASDRVQLRSEPANQMLPAGRAALGNEPRTNELQEPILDLTRALRKGCGGPECVAMLLRPSAALEGTFLVALIATGLVARRRREVAEQLEELIRAGEEQRRRSEEAVQRLKHELQVQESILLDVLQGRSPGANGMKPSAKSRPRGATPGDRWLAQERVTSSESVGQEASTSGRAPDVTSGGRPAVGGRSTVGLGRWRVARRSTPEVPPERGARKDEQPDTSPRLDSARGAEHKQTNLDTNGGPTRSRRQEVKPNLPADRPRLGSETGSGIGKGWIQSQSQSLGGALGQLDPTGLGPSASLGLEASSSVVPGRAEKVAPRGGSPGQDFAAFSRHAPELQASGPDHPTTTPPSSSANQLPPQLPAQRRPSSPAPRQVSSRGPPGAQQPSPHGKSKKRGAAASPTRGAGLITSGHVAERSACVVPDTNCYLRHFRLIRLLRKLPRVQTIVPLAVLGELDGLQQNSDPKTAFAARKAVRYFAQEIAAGAGWLRGQRQTELRNGRAVTSSAPAQGAKFPGTQPPGVTTSEALKQWRRSEAAQGRGARPADDAIIDCCLHFAADGKRVVLLTDDKALQVKAMFHKLGAASLTQYLYENLPPEEKRHLR